MKRVCMLSLCLGLLSLLVWGSTPTTMNYQGRLTDNTPQQNPVNGTVNITFTLRDAPTSGNTLWVEVWNGVQVNEGIFSVLLGSNGSPLPTALFDGTKTLYLSLNVNGETLTPRQEISAASFSRLSENSESLDGLPASDWQRRVTGTCSVGQVITAVNADGTVTCGSEDDPQVGVLSSNDVPRFSGTSLSSGSIQDDGTAVGISTPPATGTALDVGGTVEMDGFSMPTGAADGAVLTSDATGAGTWQSLACTPAFHVSASTDQTVSDTAYGWAELNNASSGENFDRCGNTELIDEYGDGTVIYRQFRAPEAGYYHFEAAVLWDNANLSETRNAIFLRVNNTDENGQWAVSGGTDFFGINISATYELNAGDVVRVRYYNGDSMSMDTFSQSGKYCWFSGFQIP